MIGRSVAFQGLPLVLVLVLVLALWSCSEDEEVDSGSEIVITDVRDVWPSVVDLSLTNPETVFGSDLTSAVELTSVRAAALLSDRGAVLLDGRLRELVIYDAQGSVRRVLGREGEGPGEFLAPSTLTRLAGDTVAVFDGRTRRLTMFSPDGEDPLVEALPPEVFDRAPISLWRLPDGSWLSFEGDIRTSEVVVQGSEADLVGVPALVRRIGPTRQASDTILSGSVASESIRVGSMFLTAAFGRSTHVGVSGDVIAIALPAGFEVRVIVGDSLRHIARMPDAELRLERAEVDRLRDSTKAASAAAGQGFMAEPIYAPELQPANRPSFGDIVVGRDGRVLLREFAPPLRHADTWWVLDPDGRFEGRVRIPPDASILEVGPEHLLALRRDAFDVPRVELHWIDWRRLYPE